MTLEELTKEINRACIDEDVEKAWASCIEFLETIANDFGKDAHIAKQALNIYREVTL